MKVVPMDQPWASLVVAGHKRIETRPRHAPKSMVGHRVAIHANRTDKSLNLVREQPFAVLLPAAHELPRGYIVGTAVLDECFQMTEHGCATVEAENPKEFALGDWKPGRWGWLLKEPVKFAVPLPFRGHQGWPDVDDAIIQLQSNVRLGK